MSEEAKVEQAAAAEATPKKKNHKKLFIVLGVFVAVGIVAFAGFWKWHETPSFCGAICHQPMDEYLATYNQDPNTAGTDKWGNQVENTSAMLCISHKDVADSECLDCHVPVMSQQISEGMKWIKKDFEYPLVERDLDTLISAQGKTNGEELCLNENCHNISREQLTSKTKKMEYNPHLTVLSSKDHETTYTCSDCHKAHRASIYVCTDCHEDAQKDLPAGWLTVEQAEKLTTHTAK